MIVTLDAKRRLTVPASLAPAMPGDRFKAEFNPQEDAIVFRRISRNGDSWLFPPPQMIAGLTIYEQKPVAPQVVTE